MPTATDHRRFNRLRWTIFGVLVVSYLTAFFHRMAPGVVAADLMRDFAISGAALGSILFGLAPDFASASAGRLLAGLGVSVVFVGLMRSNTVWFSERRYGLVSGLTPLLGNLGAILAAGPLAAVLGWYTWRTTFVAAGVASLILAALTFLLVRDRPEDAGFPPVHAAAGQTPRQHWWAELRAVLATRAVWFGFWVNIGVTGGLLAFAGLWGVPLMRDAHGLTRGDASLHTTLSLLGFAVGAFAMAPSRTASPAQTGGAGGGADVPGLLAGTDPAALGRGRHRAAVVLRPGPVGGRFRRGSCAGRGGCQA